MLLNNKHALIFAANGAISRGVAKAMAAEGAVVHLAGHRPNELASVVADIAAQGGEAHVTGVDATDPTAVRNVVDAVVADAGRIDITFNGIGGRPRDLGYPAASLDTPLDDFLLPLTKIVGSQFLTSREVARRMTAGGSIISLSATLSGGTFGHMAGISAACGAIETMTNALAAELGPRGVRVNCVRGSAMPETRTIQETAAGQAELVGEPMQMSMPPLGRMITVADTAKAAVFLASDLSAAMTAQMVTVCAGQFPTHI